MELYPLLAMFLLAAEEEGGGSAFTSMLPLLLGVFLLYYILVIRGGRRDRDRREQLLSSLKKNDRVVTIGGIIGTVANTSADGKEVTLKLEDNAKLRILRSAIQGPLSDQKQDGAAEPEQPKVEG